MKHRHALLVGTMIAVGLGLLGTGPARAACDDPAAAEAARLEIATKCICTEQTNHGQYVSCVAGKVREAVHNGLPVNCKGAVMRCAARSTCGKKDGFSTCCYALPGICSTEGKCQNGATCTDASQCPAITKCRIKSDPTLCTLSGGSPGTGSCCDAVCSLPPS